jgi:hypothetical protein
MTFSFSFFLIESKQKIDQCKDKIDYSHRTIYLYQKKNSNSFLKRNDIISSSWFRRYQSVFLKLFNYKISMSFNPMDYQVWFFTINLEVHVSILNL